MHLNITKFYIYIISACGVLLWGSMAGKATSKLSYFHAVLALDTNDPEGATYKSFRTTQDPFIEERIREFQEGKIKIYDTSVFNKKWEDLTPEDKQGIVWRKMPTREGLDVLNAAGTSQFGGSGFQEILKSIRSKGFQGNVTVIDLREEPHGFLNEEGIPFSLYARNDGYNHGRDWAELEGVESRLILDVASHLETWTPEVLLHQIEKKESTVHGEIVTNAKVLSYMVKQAYNEKHLVKDLNNCGYVRIGITDHCRAMDDDLDDFIKCYDALPQSTLKLYHCRGGKGRTTTGMVLNDILENKQKSALNFEDIILRHYLIGGSNLLAVNEDADKAWKAKAAYERIRTIYRFYQRNLQSPAIIRSFHVQSLEYKDSTYISPRTDEQKS